jgi:ribose-phosphate pyrophosphokinase
MSAYGQIAIVDVSPDKEFSTNVAKLLNLEPHNTQVDKFKDSETNIRIEQSVRGKDVYIFQSYIPPIGERLYELHNAVSATQSGGEASRVTAVMPYCFGMRGERATGARQSTQAVVVARQLYAMGVDKVITVGLHSEAVQSIFLAVGEKEGIKVEHLEFEPLAASYIIKTAQERNYRNIVIASPDVGGTKRVRKTRSIVVKNSNLDARIAIGDKYRQKQDEAEILEIIGDVRGKQVFLYDDIGDTLGTISGAVQAIKERGAQGIYLMFIHPVLGQGYERNLKQLCDDRFVKEIVFSDTIPLKEIALKCDKVRTIAIEPFIAEAIKRINADKSMSELHKYNEIMGI